MDALGKGAARLAFGAACLSLVSFASAAGSWNEIAAHESPLKTRLEWTKDVKAKHFEKWSDNFLARFWISNWANSEQILHAILSEAGPNVAWKTGRKWWKNRDGIEKQLRNVVITKQQINVKYDSRFDCIASTCIPFTVESAWNCVFFVYSGFVRNRPKSEGVLEKKLQ